MRKKEFHYVAGAVRVRQTFTIAGVRENEKRMG
jgi:hypothetical protein